VSTLVSVQNILSDVLHRGGQNPTSVTDPFYSKVLEYINRAYRDLCRGTNPLDPHANVIFRWAVKYPYSSVILQPQYTTGTVAVTNNSASITFSGTIANSVAGYHFFVTGENDVFKISAHTAGTATATLDTVYTGTTAGTATFALRKLEYTLGSNDVMRLTSPFRTYQPKDFDENYKIYGLNVDRFDSLYPLNRIKSGTPEAFKVTSISNGNYVVQFNRYMSTDMLKVDYDYVALPTELTVGTADSAILVPVEYRYVIADWALAFLFKDKNDNRYEDAVNKAKAGFAEMVAKYRYEFADVDETYGQIIARDDDYGAQQNVLRTESGLIVGFIY